MTDSTEQMRKAYLAITQLKKKIKHHLEHVNIHHATLEFEIVEDEYEDDC